MGIFAGLMGNASQKEDVYKRQVEETVGSRSE